MPNQNQLDPLGAIVKDSIRAAIQEELQTFQAQIFRNAAKTDTSVNELRINNLRGEILTKNRDFSLFSGRPMENFEEWAKKLEKQMLLKGLRPDDDTLKLIFLEFHLDGDALTKFENISSSPNPPATYDQFKNALILAFPNHHDALYHRQPLNERKQGRNETALAYFNELEKLARLAYPAFDVNARSNILEPMFLAGLQHDVRQALKFKRFGDIQSLVDEAVFVEREILRDSTAMIPIPTRYSNPCEQILTVQENIMQKQINDLNTKFDKLINQLSKNTVETPYRQKPSSKSKITCHKCGQKGHYANECDLEPLTKCDICYKEGHSKETCRSKCKHCQQIGHKHSQCPSKNPECFNCKETGHLSRECPKKHSSNQNNILGNQNVCPLDNDDPDMYVGASHVYVGPINANFSSWVTTSYPTSAPMCGPDQQKTTCDDYNRLSEPSLQSDPKTQTIQETENLTKELAHDTNIDSSGVKISSWELKRNFCLSPYTILTIALIFFTPCISCYQMCGTGLTGHSIEIPKIISCTRPEGQALLELASVRSNKINCRYIAAPDHLAPSAPKWEDANDMPHFFVNGTQNRRMNHNNNNIVEHHQSRKKPRYSHWGNKSSRNPVGSTDGVVLFRRRGM